MPRSATLLRTVFRSEPVVAATLTVAVGAAAIWVTPKAIQALQPDPPPMGEVAVEGDPPQGHEAVVDGLRRILESCYAFVGARNADADGPATLALWQTDEHRRGEINASEALIVAHSQLMRTVSATYLDGESEERVPYADLLAPDSPRRFRAFGPAATRVIATGVRDLSVATRDAGDGAAEIALTLTWDAPDVDAHNEAGPSTTTLRVRLRRVEGTGR